MPGLMFLAMAKVSVRPSQYAGALSNRRELESPNVQRQLREELRSRDL